MVPDQNSSDSAAGKQLEPVSDNIVLTSVRELSSLYANMEEIRAELRARGIKGQTTNVMVEMAFHKRQSEMQGLMDSALRSSEQEYGLGAIRRDELQEAMDKMLTMEKEIAHTRTLCKQQGLSLPVINMLAQLVRQNPGDGGTKAVNTFLGYALACNIELSGVDEVTQKYTLESESVLPDIQREVTDKSRLVRQVLLRDIVIGLTITVVMFLLVT